MGKRLSKIYTRTGDRGDTGLGDGSRISKDHARVVAMGNVDELNSFIGLCIEELKGYEALDDLCNFLKYTQHRVFDLGGEISIPGYQIINDDHTAKIETALDLLNAELEPLENFILPGGHKLIATMHLCRSVCRRAERDLVALQQVALQQEETINIAALKYLNRLSDYLFVAARYTAKQLQIEEVLWQKDI